MIEVLAITLLQPWAWCLLNGKPIENRKWRTQHVGHVLLHASKGGDAKYHDATVAQLVKLGLSDGERILSTGARIPRWDELPRGAIFGMARITDEPALPKLQEPKVPWHLPDRYGWHLRDARALPHVPCRGALGMWRVSPAVVAQLAPEMRVAGWPS